MQVLLKEKNEAGNKITGFGEGFENSKGYGHDFSCNAFLPPQNVFITSYKNILSPP